MENKVYERKYLKKPGFFQKMLGIKIKENAILEVNNLLAEKEIKSIKIEEIHHISEKYGVNFSTDYDQELSNFYREYLHSCLDDKFLSEDELEELRHLKFLLDLNDREVEAIHQDLAGEIYKLEVEKVIEDGELDEGERLFIEKLQNDLKLPKATANKIYQKSGQELIKSFMNNAIADAKLTPEEEKELNAIAKNLNAELKFDEATQSDLEKYKLYWQIENDEMPELMVDLNIPRSEKCYFMVESVQWHERTKAMEQKIHNTSALRLKITKGLYWRDAQKNTQNLKETDWHFLDRGRLYLTNKRIFFKGEKGDRIILLNRVLDFDVFTNGIELEKDRDKNPFLSLETNTDIFAMLLGKAISQLR